jgi:Peptidase family M48
VPSNLRRHIGHRLWKVSLLVALPLVLLPTRRVLARRATPTPVPSPQSSPHNASVVPIPSVRVQALIDRLKAQLGIPNPVVASLVAKNERVASVERIAGRDGAFSLVLEEAFVNGLTDEELNAVVAHELGHVWIFSHHPYLQTEELANQIALRVARRETLDAVYEKVWQRTGTKGTLVYLPRE